ncbi:MAG: TIGR03905 family TSCPD domain-containing protein [Lachnospiraceae bacterium]|nr:TIGR03905 family TSCPD domain-containing protein [Lachnospiraceae bacterium]MBR5789974.1 TIGR03905 family TSCPD domain-containing protein [Lachnospiraceae bacterium]
MEHFTYKTENVCSRQIDFDVENGIIHNVSFLGGCNGNLKAISKLVEGMPADKVIEILRGNTCGDNTTSCADQLTKALEQINA